MSIADKLKTIAENIPKIYNTAHTDGYEIGHQEGHYDGVKDEYDRFWNAYQENGNRTSYLYAFAGRAWIDEAFKPKYPIQTNNATGMFYYSAIAHIDCEIDFADPFLGLTNMFYGAWVERISQFKSYQTLGFASTTFASC